MVTEDQLSIAIKQARKQTLDLLEGSYGRTPEWTFIRSRILKIFGNGGLEKLLTGTGCSKEQQEGMEENGFNKGNGKISE